MANKKIAMFLVFVLIFLLFFMVFMGFVYAGDILTVEADIIVPQKIVSIQVDDYVHLGNLTVGYKMYTDEYKVFINNTGSVNISVTPVLNNFSEEVFSNLYFTERLSGDRYGWGKIWEWDMDIEMPSSVGGVEKEYFYMRLDLRNSSIDFKESMLGHKTDVAFIAVES